MDEGLQVAIGPNNIYVSWYTDDNPFEIFIKKSKYGGLSFGSATEIYSSTSFSAYNSDLAVKLYNVYVTRREETQSGLRLVIK